MSKLPNAPLREVIFELKWKPSKQEFSEFQFFFSDLYSSLKSVYPERENLLPADIPVELTIGAPAFRFRAVEKGYPLYQIGQGILTFNVNDENYFKEQLFESVEELLKSFAEAKKFTKIDNLKPTLTFIDFIDVDFSKNHINDFINESFNIQVIQSFYPDNNPDDLNIDFSFAINHNKVSIQIKKGKLNKSRDGVALITKVIGEDMSLDPDKLIDWIKESQEISSDLFKKITQGGLYDSFK
ncbi:MAG: TIGR04255 family protein [Flavobacteriales bacterium]|nr:TIGR04255 family protein [Flavobacteriales bacterium]